METRYRVVLTGELIHGHDLNSAVAALAALLNQPPEKVRLVFNRRATPLNKTTDYRRAKAIEQRLAAIGVASRVEALDSRPPATFAARELENPPATSETPPMKAPITCPNCSKVQPAADQCDHCGAVFSRFWTLGTSGLCLEIPSAAPPDDAELAKVYVGPGAERYGEKFERFARKGSYAPGWNWAAFFGGAVWTAYRKLWLWTAVELLIVALSLLIPWLALLLQVGFTLSADYLYYRHVRGRVANLGGESIATVAAAGGRQWGAAGVAALASTFLVVWIGLAQLPKGFRQMAATLQSDPQLAVILGTPGGISTAAAMTLLADSAYHWQEEGGDLRTITISAVVEESLFPQEALRDGWGTPLQMGPSNGGFVVVSAGPDRLFDSDDDVPVFFPGAAHP